MSTELLYAGFWRRFGAFWLDALFLLPLMLVVFWANSRFRMFQTYYLLPGLAFSAFYGVYLVKRFGGTPGKLVAGLRITKLDGSAIGYREAILRAGPDYLLSLVSSLALAVAASRMNDSEYLSLTFIERSQRLKALAPGWHQPVQLLLTIWIWSEFVVLLTNKKKRALHDFIAGTVVIVKGPNQALQPTPMLVTPRADARAAPSTGVADL